VPRATIHESRGAKGMDPTYGAGSEVEGHDGLLVDVCGRAGARGEVLYDDRHVSALLSEGFEVSSVV
jgi:hypothetical protein